MESSVVAYGKKLHFGGREETDTWRVRVLGSRGRVKPLLTVEGGPPREQPACGPCSPLCLVIHTGGTTKQ